MESSDTGRFDQEYSDRLAAIIAEFSGWDSETAHRQADDLVAKLLENLGCPKTAAAFKAMPKWFA